VSARRRGPGRVIAGAAALVVGAALGLWLFGERWRLIRPSTLRSARGGGGRGGSRLGGIHAYVYGRWTNQYLDVLVKRILPRLDEEGLKWWRDRYHGKVLTLDQAEAIVLRDHDLPRQDLGEQIIPYPLARDIVLTGTPDVAAYECACRHARRDHCEPTQVCMIVGTQYVDFLLEHNPHSTRRLTQAEAVDLLRAEHERGHVHSAWFKDAMDGRFYAICNCCPCCCAGIEAMTEYGSPMMASSGFVARPDADACSGCGECVEACPFGALSLEDVARVDWDVCMGCGACETQCPAECMELVRDERKGEPLDVRLLA
jgi:NAD-dependent dihydropyrimidine dehydrogenase PreA subunit